MFLLHTSLPHKAFPEVSASDDDGEMDDLTHIMLEYILFVDNKKVISE